MFKHKQAPLCKFSKKCKVTKCQFAHTFNDVADESKYDSDSDIVGNGIQISENLECESANIIDDENGNDSPTTPFGDVTM